MNEIVNKFLLTGHNFIPEMYLRQPWFTYSACGPFTKNKERIQKFKETEESQYIYKNKLGKACFQHGMAYGDFKDLTKKQLLIKYYLKKHLILLRIQNTDINMDLLMIYKFFDKKLLVEHLQMKLCLIKN